MTKFQLEQNRPIPACAVSMAHNNEKSCWVPQEYWSDMSMALRLIKAHKGYATRTADFTSSARSKVSLTLCSQYLNIDLTPTT